MIFESRAQKIWCEASLARRSISRSKGSDEDLFSWLILRNKILQSEIVIIYQKVTRGVQLVPTMALGLCKTPFQKKYKEREKKFSRKTLSFWGPKRQTRLKWHVSHGISAILNDITHAFDVLGFGYIAIYQCWVNAEANEAIASGPALHGAPQGVDQK